MDFAIERIEYSEIESTRSEAARITQWWALTENDAVRLRLGRALQFPFSTRANPTPLVPLPPSAHPAAHARRVVPIRHVLAQSSTTAASSRWSSLAIWQWSWARGWKVEETNLQNPRRRASVGGSRGRIATPTVRIGPVALTQLVCSPDTQPHQMRAPPEKAKPKKPPRFYSHTPHTTPRRSFLLFLLLPWLSPTARRGREAAITASKPAMEGAEAEERRLAASLTARYSDWVVEALDELPGSFILTDPAMPGHPIVYASRGLASLTGYPPREVLGRNARLFQGADTDRAAVAGVREAVRGQRPHQVSILNYRRDGEAHWVLLHLAPVFHASDGRVLHFLAVQVPIAPPASRRRTPPCRAARPPVVFAACREEARVEEECPARATRGRCSWMWIREVSACYWPCQIYQLRSD